MYEKHFGLTRRPFRAKATGSDVFVGPQAATTMAGLKSALVASDAAVTVSGPVGSGKTTLVLKALESMSGQHKVVRIGRMRLQSSDILALLLTELDIENPPNGAIQQFNAFRRCVKELEDNGTRLVIAVEDSPRLGVDTLAEIEALTAADAGLSEGANVILMGDEKLDNALRDPQLSRLQQRIRQKLQMTPLPAAELRGYLRHCFRLAGGDFEQVFETDAAPLLHHMTGGVPRVANTVLETAMTAAAERGQTQVPSELLARIGENEFGLSAAGFEFSPPPAAAPPAAVETVVPPVIEPIEPAAEAVIPPPVEPVADTQAHSADPTSVFADVPEPADLPELIQDTLPDLQVLAPEVVAAAPEPPVLAMEPPAEPEAPVLAIEPAAEPEAPVLAIEPAAEPEAPVLTVEPTVMQDTPDSAEIPDWDRDPTMAELRPDLDALEQAMAFAQPDELELESPAAKANDNPADPPSDEIPEITLDHAISQRIESNLIDEPGEISPVREDEPAHDETRPELPELDLPAKKPAKSDTEIEKIAAELSRAKSLEDVDDRMAETLFGDEFSLVASQFMKKAVVVESANDDIEEIAEVPDVAAVANQEQRVATSSQAAQSAPPANSLDVEVTMEATGRSRPDGGMDLSASQRLKTVRALNADLHPSLREPGTPAANDAPRAEEPDSIEDQINTSITQTLEALKVRPPVGGLNDDEEEKSKSGFFSRFKRS